MTNPWEQEWHKGDGKDNGMHLFGVYHAKGYCTVMAANEEDARFIAAAPDMARALMGPSGKGHHHYNPQHDEYACQQCAHFAPAHSDGCEFGKALRKAGVPL